MGDEAKEQDLFRQFPRFQELSRRVLQEVLAEHQAQLGAFRSERAELRYQRLVRDRPELLQRVPQYQIASYLGVLRPESLSRLRRRLVTAARRPKSRSPA